MIEKQLESIVRDFCGVGEDEAFDLQSSVESLDSLDKLELVYRIEEKMGIKIDNLDNIQGFDDLIRITKRKLASK